MHSFDPRLSASKFMLNAAQGMRGADINMEILTLHQGGSTVHTLNARLLGLDTCCYTVIAASPPAGMQAAVAYIHISGYVSGTVTSL